MIELSPEVAGALGNGDPFDSVLALDGELFRRHKHRRTFRVALDGGNYFVKVHGNTRPIEILKNAISLRWPVLTAACERRAIERLNELGVPVPRIAGYGCRGRSPAWLESFVITEALDGTLALDEAAVTWRSIDPDQRQRLQRAAVREVARITRLLHGDGMNHRDLYLCHFLVHDRDWSKWKPEDGLVLYLIDLHRAQQRRRVPSRWRAKDLAGLLFSAFDVGVSHRCCLQFLREYSGGNLRRSLENDAFLRRVFRRAVRLYQAERGTPPPLSGGLASFA